MNLKGSLPLLILHTLQSGQLHGYAIAKLIKEESEGILDFKEGTLYPTLHGLQKQGMIEMFQEIENGRQRNYYRLTTKGRESLESELDEWREYTRAVNAVLKGVTPS